MYTVKMTQYSISAVTCTSVGWRSSAAVSRTGCSATTDDAFPRAACAITSMTVIIPGTLGSTTPMKKTADVRLLHFVVQLKFCLTSLVCRRLLQVRPVSR